MFNDIKFENKLQNITDFGASRILGMNGSLTGYINTGNAYDRRYYIKPKQDRFESIISKKKKKDTIIKSLVAGAIALLGAFALYKKGYIKLPKLPKLPTMSDLKQKISLKPRQLFNKIFKKSKNAQTVADGVAEAGKTVSEVVKPVSSQIDKFNKRLQGADLNYIEKRAQNAATKASNTKLSEHKKVIENALNA